MVTTPGKYGSAILTLSLSEFPLWTLRLLALISRCNHRRDGGKQEVKPLHKRRVSQNSFAESGVWQPRNHCNLDRSHDLSSIDGEAGKPQYPIAVRLNESFKETACFGKRACA